MNAAPLRHMTTPGGLVKRMRSMPVLAALLLGTAAVAADQAPAFHQRVTARVVAACGYQVASAPAHSHTSSV